MELFKPQFTEFLTQITITLIGLLAAYAMAGINFLAKKAIEQTKQIKDTGARKLFEDALKDVDYLATVTVKAIEQTTAKALREEVKAGTKSRDLLCALSTAAAAEIRNAIKPETKKLIDENLGSFELYVSKLIEKKVLELKTVKE